MLVPSIYPVAGPLEPWVRMVRFCAEHDIVYEMFMQPDATAEQISAARSVIDLEPRVTLLEFLTQADAFREFRANFAGQKSITGDNTAADLPASFRLRIDRGTEEAVVQTRQAVPGVDEVVSPSAMCDQLSPMSGD